VTGYMSLGGSMGKAKAFSLDTLKDIATTHERTPAIVLQRWAIHKNISVIPGSGNPAHMKENLDVFSFELSDDEILRIDALSQDPIMSYPEFLNK
jgi:diketogulonate reductase-like aldo/keto reductase